MSEDTGTKRRTFTRARRAAVGYSQGFSAGVVLGRAVYVWIRLFVPLTLAAAPVYALFLGVRFVTGMRVAVSLGLMLALAPLLLAGFYANPVAAALDGRRFRWREFLADGTRGFLAVLSLAPPLIVAVAVGLALFVIPGIALILLGFLAIPCAAREGVGPLAAVKRSFALTARCFPDVFAAMASLLLIPVVTGALLPWLGARPDAIATTLWAVGFVVLTLLAILPTVIRHELTNRD